MSEPGAEALSESDQALLRALRTHKLACPHCTYDLGHATSLRCPECGRVVEAKAYRIGKVFPKSVLLVASIVGACTWLVYGPVGLIALRATYDVPPRPLAAVLGIGTVLGMLLLVWSLAYRPLRWLDQPRSVHFAMWALLVAPAALLLGAMVAGAVWAVVAALRVL